MIYYKIRCSHQKSIHMLQCLLYNMALLLCTPKQTGEGLFNIIFVSFVQVSSLRNDFMCKLQELLGDGFEHFVSLFCFG